MSKHDQYFITDFKNKSSINLKSKNQILFMDQPPSADNETYSARMLLQRPELKKQTWDFLKKYILV